MTRRQNRVIVARMSLLWDAFCTLVSLAAVTPGPGAIVAEKIFLAHVDQLSTAMQYGW